MAANTLDNHEAKLRQLGLLDASLPKSRTSAAELQQAKAHADRLFLSGIDAARFKAEKAERAIDLMRRFHYTVPADDGAEPSSDDIWKLSRITEELWPPQAAPVRYGTLLLMNELFLRGQLPASPSHAGAITGDVASQSLRTLLDINRLGFYTIDSQPGTCEPTKHAQTGEDGFEIQREYILGLYPVTLWKALFCKLMEHDVNIYVYSGQNRMLARYESDASLEPVYAALPFDDAQGDLVLTAGRLASNPQWSVDTRLARYRGDFPEAFGYLKRRYWEEQDKLLRAGYVGIEVASSRLCGMGQTSIDLLDALVQVILSVNSQ